MIKQAKAHHRMLEELYGSQTCLTAILGAINRRFVIDMFKQKRRSGAIAGVDAAQCYDRIVYSLSILLYQREGALASSLMMIVSVIQCMIYFIRTTLVTLSPRTGIYKTYRSRAATKVTALVQEYGLLFLYI